jgi:hypothetical protein
MTEQKITIDKTVHQLALMGKGRYMLLPKISLKQSINFSPAITSHQPETKSIATNHQCKGWHPAEASVNKQ